MQNQAAQQPQPQNKAIQTQLESVQNEIVFVIIMPQLLNLTKAGAWAGGEGEGEGDGGGEKGEEEVGKHNGELWNMYYLCILMFLINDIDG